MLQPYRVKPSPMLQQGQSPTTSMLNTLGNLAGTAIGGTVGGPAGAAAGGALGSQLGNVATGEALNPAQMAISGLSAGMSAGAKGVTEAKNALEAAKTAGEGVEAAQAALTAAEGSIFNDPFGKAGDKIKSVFMFDGGQVKQTKEKAFKTGPLNPYKDKDGNLVLPKDFDFSRLRLLPESPEQGSLDQQQEYINYKNRLTEEANRKVAESNKAQNLYSGGKAKGPLCSSCEAEYKSCGGMTKKKY